MRVVDDWYVELRGPIAHYLGTLGCSPPLAEELTQEAFLRLYRGLEAGLVIHDPRAWLFRVARNLWIDHRREAQRFTSLSDIPFPDSGPDPEQQVLRRERLRRMGAQFARLPELERECLHLKSLGLPYRTIALLMGISVNAVVESVRRGMARLRRRATGL